MSTPSTFTIAVRDRLVFDADGNVFSAPAADRIARANMEEWNVAEHFVKAFNGKIMVLDSTTYKEVLP